MLLCENDREAKRYFKMQSVHGSYVYRMIPYAQYKPQHWVPEKVRTIIGMGLTS